MKKVITVLGFLLVGCPSQPIQRPFPPPYPPVDTEWCSEMCEHIGREGLKCEEGEPVYNSDVQGPEGVPNQTCGDWCRELQDKGYFVNPRCVSLVPSCNLIEEYRQKDPETCRHEKP